MSALPAGIPFGDHLVLAGAEDEPLRLLDAVGAEVWHRLTAGDEPAAIIRDLAPRFDMPPADLQRRLEVMAAWVREAFPASDAEVAKREADTGQLSVPSPEPLLLGEASRRIYALCGRPIAACFVPPALEGLVHPRFAHSEQPEAEATASLTLLRTRSGYALTELGRPPILARSAQTITGEFVRRFVELSHPPTHWIAVLHAAALAAPNRRTILLPGTNGSGKSTLAAGLIAAGFTYFSDDCVPIDRQGRVVAVPFGLCLKEPSWEAARLLPGFVEAPLGLARDGRRCRYIAPPAPSPGPSSPSLIVFPSYAPGATHCLRDLDRADTLQRLVASRAWLSRDPGDLAAALGLIAGLPAYALVYGNLSEAVATIRELAQCGDRVEV